MGSGYPDIAWHGARAWQPDWSEQSRMLGFMLDGKHAGGGLREDNSIYVFTNAYWEGQDVELPGLPEGQRWHVFANTGAPETEEVWEPGTEPPLSDQSHLFVGARSVVILVAK